MEEENPLEQGENPKSKSRTKNKPNQNMTPMHNLDRASEAVEKGRQGPLTLFF